MDIRPSDIPANKLVLFVVKGTATSTHNTVKPLILLEELGIPHDIYVVEKVSAPWFRDINPHKMVPAVEDQLPDGKGCVRAWESSSTLTYITDAYDLDGKFGGSNLGERTEIGNWLTLHTAALGPTAKYWLYFHALHPEKLPKAIAKLSQNITVQYDILERRLNEPGQSFLALPDRPTIADIAFLPFAMESTANLFGHELGKWPKLQEWSIRMGQREAVKRAWQRCASFGHGEKEYGHVA
ncbi:Glutathione S-transferase/chloride channel, C-terminal [Penicillium expansum]|nr:Glutathione S-transferase/chloride channel, C-terminal [Penicillium expansum]